MEGGRVGGGRQGRGSWQGYRCIASASYRHRNRWSFSGEGLILRKSVHIAAHVFFPPSPPCFYLFLNVSSLFPFPVSMGPVLLLALGTLLSFSIPLFLFLSALLLPVSVVVSCVLLWQIKHPIHFMSSFFQKTINAHLFLFSVRCSVHFAVKSVNIAQAGVAWNYVLLFVISGCVWWQDCSTGGKKKIKHLSKPASFHLLVNTC